MLKEKFEMLKKKSEKAAKPALEASGGAPPPFNNPGFVRIALLALTLAFVGAIAYAALRENSAEPRGEYSVSVERSISPEEIVPEKRLLNVNTASAEELETLNGIGPALAQAIIDYRAEHGDFASVDELCEVSGIGEAKLNGICEYVTVGGNE